MATMVRPKEHPVESLPSDQVSLLLRTLALHRSLLDAAHQDAKRFANGARPCYVLDYELIHRFIYDQRENPEAVVEFWHLLQQEDIKFIIGHGTIIEILYRVERATGIHLPLLEGVNTYEDFLARWPILSDGLDKSLRRLIQRAPQHGRAMYRLAQVLKRRNLLHIWHLEHRLGTGLLDKDAYAAVLGALDSVRPGKHYSNAADAMNFANVVGLRDAWVGTGESLFPFLLTDTRPLLDESQWAADPYADKLGYEGTVSRTPLMAIYSHLFLPTHPSLAVDVANKTADLKLDAAVLERDLQHSPGYQDDLVYDENWDAIVSHKGVSEPLAQQLRRLSNFVRDPAISQSQRIYDNSKLTAANSAGQYGGATPLDSPRQVFDIVLNVSQVLSEQGNPTPDLGALWSSVIDRQVERASNWTTLRYFRADDADAGIPYLEAERHSGYTVFRWPSRGSGAELISAFSQSYERHGLSAVELYVGAEYEVVKFQAELPLTFDEIVDGLRQAESDDEEFGEILWVRTNAEPYDLYGDIIPANPGVDPIVGVTATDYDIAHLREFYWATSSRFIFGAWLGAIILDAQGEEWIPDASL